MSTTCSLRDSARVGVGARPVGAAKLLREVGREVEVEVEDAAGSTPPPPPLNPMLDTVLNTVCWPGTGPADGPPDLGAGVPNAAPPGDTTTQPPEGGGGDDTECARGGLLGPVDGPPLLPLPPLPPPAPTATLPIRSSGPWASSSRLSLGVMCRSVLVLDVPPLVLREGEGDGLPTPPLVCSCTEPLTLPRSLPPLEPPASRRDTVPYAAVNDCSMDRVGEGWRAGDRPTLSWAGVEEDRRREVAAPCPANTRDRTRLTAARSGGGPRLSSRDTQCGR